MKCARCEHENKPGVKFCGGCGAPTGEPSIHLCPSCGATLKPDAKFCGGCGTTLTAKASAPAPASTPSVPTSCPSCGAILKPNAKFCGSCGSTLTAKASTPAPTPAPTGAPVQQKKKICLSCMNTFAEEELSDFEGQPYCGQCLPIIQARSSEVIMLTEVEAPKLKWHDKYRPHIMSGLNVFFYYLIGIPVGYLVLKQWKKFWMTLATWWMAAMIFLPGILFGLMTGVQFLVYIPEILMLLVCYLPMVVYMGKDAYNIAYDISEGEQDDSLDMGFGYAMAFFAPGMGHIYAGNWLSGILWMGLFTAIHTLFPLNIAVGGLFAVVFLIFDIVLFMALRVYAAKEGRSYISQSNQAIKAKNRFKADKAWNEKYPSLSQLQRNAPGPASLSDLADQEEEVEEAVKLEVWEEVFSPRAQKHLDADDREGAAIYLEQVIKFAIEQGNRTKEADDLRHQLDQVLKGQV